jgi:hypothetical protein
MPRTFFGSAVGRRPNLMAVSFSRVPVLAGFVGAEGLLYWTRPADQKMIAGSCR